MAELKITDLVDQSAIDGLKNLSKELKEVKEQYEAVARKMLEGLKIKVELSGDVEKLNAVLAAGAKKAEQATTRLNKAVQQQNEIVARTTNTISRELAEIEKENAKKREAVQVDQQAHDLAVQTLGTLEQNIVRLAKMRAEMEALKNERKDGTITEAQFLSKERELKIAMQELNGVINNQQKIANSVDGSYTNLSLKLELLKKAFKGLTDEEKKSAAGQQMAAEIQNLDAALKDSAADMGEFQRNVGNYAIANKSLWTELKDLQAEMANMLLNGAKPTDEAFQDLVKRAGDLRDAMSDAKAITNQYADSAQSLSTVIDVAQTGTAAFGAFKGSLAVFGVEGEETNKVIARMSAVTATLNSLKQIQNGLTDKQTATYRIYHKFLQLVGLEKKAETAAEQANTAAQVTGTTSVVAHTTATEGATVATRIWTGATALASKALHGLKAAIMTTGIGALVVALGYLLNALVDWVSEAANAPTENDELADSLDRVGKSADAAKSSIEKINGIQLESGSIDEYTKNMEAYNASLTRWSQNIDLLNESLRNYNGYAAKLGMSAEAYVFAAREGKTATDVHVELAQKLQKVYDSITKGHSTWDEYVADIKSTNEEVLQLQEFEEELKGKIEDLNGSSEQAAQATINYIDAIVAARNAALESAEANNKLFESVAKIHQEAVDSVEQNADVIASLMAYDKQINDTTLSDEKRIEAMRNVNKETGKQVFNLDDTKDALKNCNGVIDTYIKNLIKEAEAQALANKIAANYIRMLDLQTKFTKTNDGRWQGPANLIQEYNDLTNANQSYENELKKLTSTIKVYTDYNEKKTNSEKRSSNGSETRAKDAKDAATKELQAKRKAEDEAAKLEKDEWKRRTVQTKYQYERQIEDLQRQLDTEKNLTKEAREAIKETITSLKEQEVIELDKIEKERESEIEEQRKELLDKEEKAFAARQVVADHSYQEQVAAAKKAYAEGVITEEEFNARSEKLADEYAKSKANDTIAYLKKILDSEELTEEEREKLEERLKQAQIDSENAVADAVINANKRKMQSDQQRLEKAQTYLQKAGEALDEINNLTQSVFDNKVANVEEEEERLNEQYEADKQRIQDLNDAGVISKEEADQRMAALDESKAAKEAELQEKMNKMKEKQAKVDKANSLVQAAIATALGIMQVYAQPSNGGFISRTVMAATLAAIGAIQIATIAAQPLPKYAKGTDSHKGGYAIVGDGGKQELVTFGGNAYVTPDTPTLVNLPRGAKVHPDALDVTGLNPFTGFKSISDTKMVVNPTNVRGIEKRTDETNRLLKMQLSQERRLAYDMNYRNYKTNRL